MIVHLNKQLSLPFIHTTSFDKMNFSTLVCEIQVFVHFSFIFSRL